MTDIAQIAERLDEPTPAMVEAVALALVNFDIERFDLSLLTSVDEFKFDADRDHHLALARAAISAVRAYLKEQGV